MFIIEIWPPRCKSAIHDHAGTYGVVKVLSGQIHNLQFPYLSNCHTGKTSISDEEFKKDDVFYFTPKRNQIHQI
jgi:hypothetical protein